jgi:hypothetical protein
MVGDLKAPKKHVGIDACTSGEDGIVRAINVDICRNTSKIKNSFRQEII